MESRSTGTDCSWNGWRAGAGWTKRTCSRTSPRWPRHSPRSTTSPRRKHRPVGPGRHRSPRSTWRFLDGRPGNLLFDPSGSLTGVIDWSAASLGPPEYDVAELRAHVSLLAGIDAADRALSTYKALTGRQLPNQAWFDLRAAISLFCPEPSHKWEWLDPRLNAQLLRPRFEAFVFEVSRELR